MDYAGERLLPQASRPPRARSPRLWHNPCAAPHGTRQRRRPAPNPSLRLSLTANHTYNSSYERNRWPCVCADAHTSGGLPTGPLLRLSLARPRTHTRHDGDVGRRATQMYAYPSRLTTPTTRDTDGTASRVCVQTRTQAAGLPTGPPSVARSHARAFERCTTATPDGTQL